MLQSVAEKVEKQSPPRDLYFPAPHLIKGRAPKSLVYASFSLLIFHSYTRQYNRDGVGGKSRTKNKEPPQRQRNSLIIYTRHIAASRCCCCCCYLYLTVGCSVVCSGSIAIVPLCGFVICIFQKVLLLQHRKA